MKFKGLMVLVLFSLMGSVVAQEVAVDHGTYCEKFLNGELGERPDMLNDFTFKVAKLRVNGVERQSIVAEGPNNQVNTVARSTKFNRKKGVEVEDIAVFAKNRRGKNVKVYTIEITRDGEGRVLELRKVYPVTRVFNGQILPEVVTLNYRNNKCYPSEYRKNLKRQFSAEYCRELQAYFEENPKALECMKSGYDAAVGEIIAKYDTEYRLLGTKKRYPSVFTGKALGQCSDYGILNAENMDDQSRVVSDDALWSAPAASNPTVEEIMEQSGSANGE